MLSESSSDDIQIQSPPIQELEKKTSWLKRSCLALSGCFILFCLGIAGVLFYLRLPKTKEVQTIPANFPDSVPVYDSKNIDTITVDPARPLPPFFSNIANMIGRKINYIPKELQNRPNEIIKIQWDDLSAKPSFVIEYYTKALTKKHFWIDQKSFNSGRSQIMQFATSTFSGTLTIQDKPESSGTDSTELEIRLPVQVEE
jgi:predicted PurR-regulated permease PerM